jgi:DNA-binding GntR family transcriptional regulator
VGRLRALWHEGEAAVESGETERVVTANNKFHAELALIAGNAVLADLAGIVSRRVRWYYRQVAPARGHESWTEHWELIDAVAAHDEEKAAEIARRHTERTRSAYHEPSGERLTEAGPR